MRRVLITGAAGFAGRYLAALLADRGEEIVGGDLHVDRIGADDPLRCRLDLREVDVRSEDRIAPVLEDVRPDVIYHMAAVVPIALALESPALPLNTNILGTANLFQAIRKVGIDARIVMGGSSEEYGRILPGEAPVAEDQPLRPSNPYAVSKVAQTLLGVQYFRSYGLKVMVGRAFNLTGPGQPPEYACSAFARQIAQIEADLAEPVVRVGNLTPRRDYNDIRDIVRGYALLAERGEPGEIYNICTGQAYSIQEILDRLVAMARVDIRVEVDPARVRPAENELIIGDNRKLVAATGFRPTYPIERTLGDVLDYWRSQVGVAKEGS